MKTFPAAKGAFLLQCHVKKRRRTISCHSSCGYAEAGTGISVGRHRMKKEKNKNSPTRRGKKDVSPVSKACKRKIGTISPGKPGKKGERGRRTLTPLLKKGKRKGKFTPV